MELLKYATLGNQGQISYLKTSINIIGYVIGEHSFPLAAPVRM